MTSLQPCGLPGVLLEAAELSFFESWISAFPLSFTDNFFGGAEEEPALEVAVGGAKSCLGHLQTGFSILTIEVPAWLEEMGDEGSQSLYFFAGSGSVGAIIVVFNKWASLVVKGPF